MPVQPVVMDAVRTEAQLSSSNYFLRSGLLEVLPHNWPSHLIQIDLLLISPEPLFIFPLTLPPPSPGHVGARPCFLPVHGGAPPVGGQERARGGSRQRAALPHRPHLRPHGAGDAAAARESNRCLFTSIQD